MPDLKQLARTAFVDVIGTTEHDPHYYNSSTSIIYERGFDDGESLPSIPGPSLRGTMK
jgi:hypothetical protein